MCEWKRVSDTSPPWDGKKIVVWNKTNEEWISARTTEHDWHLFGRKPPTHWLPLPKTPIT